MLNSAVLIGRLTKDVELRYTNSNIAVASFNLAVNRDYANQDGQREADFINIRVWRKQAENASKYLTKGSSIAVVGSIRTEHYEYEGQKKISVYVLADSIKFLDNKKAEPQTSDDMQLSEKNSNIDLHKDEDNIYQSSLDLTDELPF